VPDNGCMTQDKNANKRAKNSKDRHKPGVKSVRIRPGLAESLQQVCDLNETDFTEEVNRAVLEYLQRMGVRPRNVPQQE
jgi:hypothetical protein